MLTWRFLSIFLFVFKSNSFSNSISRVFIYQNDQKQEFFSYFEIPLSINKSDWRHPFISLIREFTLLQVSLMWKVTVFLFYFDDLDQVHFLQKSIKFSPLTRYIWKYIRSNGGGWKNTHPHEAVMIENGQDNDTLMDTICEEWRRKWVTIVRVSSTTSFILGSSSTFWSTFKAKFLFT